LDLPRVLPDWSGLNRVSWGGLCGEIGISSLIGEFVCGMDQAIQQFTFAFIRRVDRNNEADRCDGDSMPVPHGGSQTAGEAVRKTIGHAASVSACLCHFSHERIEFGHPRTQRLKEFLGKAGI
jgi:hypothetical protein